MKNIRVEVYVQEADAAGVLLVSKLVGLLFDSLDPALRSSNADLGADVFELADSAE